MGCGKREALPTDGGGPRVEGNARNYNGSSEVSRRSTICNGLESSVACTRCQSIMQQSTKSSWISARCVSPGNGKAGQMCVVSVPLRMQARLAGSMAVLDSTALSSSTRAQRDSGSRQRVAVERRVTLVRSCLGEEEDLPSGQCSTGETQTSSSGPLQEWSISNPKSKPGATRFGEERAPITPLCERHSQTRKSTRRPELREPFERCHGGRQETQRWSATEARGEENTVKHPTSNRSFGQAQLAGVQFSEGAWRDDFVTLDR